MTGLPTLPRLSDYAAHYARIAPDREAAVLGDERLTYRALGRAVDAMAAALLASGLAKGDRVAMLSTPRPEYLVALLATVSIGGVWVGLNPRYRLGEFRHVLEETRPKIVLALPEIDGRRYDEELATLQVEFACVTTWIAIAGSFAGSLSMTELRWRAPGVGQDRLEAARADVTREDTAVIIFTSGSTGAPKGAMLRHHGLVHGALIENERWPSAAPRILNNMPINHIACIGMLSAYALVAGGTLIFMDRFDPAGMLALLARERVTFWLQAPTMFHFAVTTESFARTDLGALQYIVWAGAPMARDLVTRLHGLGARLATAFGMTELSTYVTYSDADASADVLATTIGRPDPRYELRVVDGAGAMVGAGGEGELQARGDWIMSGYVNHPGASAAAMTADGWFRTGDIARVMVDGNLQLVGRMKEMYKSGGYNIYPREIEIAIEAEPRVAMAAVIGVDDPVYHEVGHAFVQPEPGAMITAAELDAWCRVHIANYKVPKRFTVMAELPRLPIGKIDKVTLRRSLT